MARQNLAYIVVLSKELGNRCLLSPYAEPFKGARARMFQG